MYRIRTLAIFAMAVLLLLNPRPAAETVQTPVDIKGNHLHMIIDPKEGGAVQRFGSLSATGNHAAGFGLLQEGFGVGSHYVPNRRLNERLEVIDDPSGRPVLVYRYECDGPNISGLNVIRKMELMPDEMSMRVSWTITNSGKEAQWVAPWLLNQITPGGNRSTYDRLDIPTTRGILDPAEPAYHLAARNWIAATDPMEIQSFYCVFHADHAYSYLIRQTDTAQECQTAFVPQLLEPGRSWKTVYRVNTARGLEKIDFATDELAAQLEYTQGKLSLLISPAKLLSKVTLHASILAENDRVWRLPVKNIELKPGQLVRCTFDWEAPAEGRYDFLAQLRKGDTPVMLGADTGSPHGGIDTQFVVGEKVPGHFEAWTDAPYALQRGTRKLKRPLAHAGATPIYFASGLEKIFHEDRIEAIGMVDPAYTLALARGESESFQVVLQPPADAPLLRVQVMLHDLVNTASGKRIPASAITPYRVHYHQVDIPSHFEGPTGMFPDALLPMEPFTAPGGEATPIWFTLNASKDLPAGTYTGMIEIAAVGLEPVELWLNVRVFDFTLPETPSLKTDFGIKLTNPAQAQAWRDNAAAHRVTLRGLSPFPRESGNYQADLKAFLKAMKPAVTTYSVPPSLLDTPALLQEADAFVVKHGLEDRVFVQLADNPQKPAWPRVLEQIQHWEDLAPHIPVMVTTFGLEPFLLDGLDIWNVHAQVLDTPRGKHVMERIAGGKEVWWYINHMPPRPYGNFFLDFAAIEHRILFWQSWALGIKGMSYWNVNYIEPGQDPFHSDLDITPVNGDGLLLYPGKTGPVNSIRWEVIRDGLEDHDYLTRFHELRQQLGKQGGHNALLQRATNVGNLNEVIPSLVSFTRDPEVLLQKRFALGEIIEEMTKVAGK